MSLGFDIDIAIMQRRRVYTPTECRADLCIHILGLAAATVGAAIMLTLAATHGDKAKLGAVLVYTVGLIMMLGASAAYNISCSVDEEARLRALLRRCDHSAIFLMIAGTFTPFAMSWKGGPAGIVIFVIWLAAGCGIALKWLAPLVFEQWSVVLFLALGWMALTAMWPIGARLPPESLAALLAGSALYSGGIVFHLWDRLPFQNAIWHGFVLAGAVCHYFAILEGVVLLPSAFG
jgi:hemolysin III